MSKARKFKTISGALRSLYETFKDRQQRQDYARGIERSKEEKPAMRLHYLRGAVNHVLPQVGITSLIESAEEPYEGLKRIKATLTDPKQIKAVDDCLRFKIPAEWTVTVGEAISGERIVDGKKITTYEVGGFYRADHGKRCVVVVDKAEDGPEAFDQARAIGGPEICFHFSQNVFAEVPDDLKGKLLTYEELYARVPTLNPDRGRQGRRAR